MAIITVLFDTTTYAAFKQGLSDAVDIVRQAPQIIVSSVVLGELLAGFAVGLREEKNRTELQQFLTSTRITSSCAISQRKIRSTKRQLLLC